jgi:AmmeMemoRadiSam system protein B
VPAQHHVLRLCIILYLVVTPLMPGCLDAAVRKPAWAGTFYPETAADLTLLINRLFSQAESSSTAHRSHDRLRALIIPHAGYRYSGLTAAHAALAIPPNGFDRVVLI